MTPQELRTSVLNKAMQGFFVNAEWQDEESSIYRYLWEVTTWDKKFKGIDKYKQKEVISYHYYLAADMRALERPNGDVYLLSTGQYEGYTYQELVADTMSEGEVVSIPWGGTPTVKYYKGKFVTSDNRIATSNDTGVLLNKFLYYYMLSQYDYLKSIYRGTGLKHPEMVAVLDMRIPIPSISEQEQTIAKIEELLPLIDRYEQAWSKLEDFNKRFPVDMQKSILQMAIQGKLVPQLSEEGTGEELFLQIQTEKQRLIKEGIIKKEKPLPEITEDEIPFDIPDSWKWVRFDNLCAVLTCGYASTPTYVSKENGMPFISAKNVKPYRFMPEDHNYIPYDLYGKLTQNAKPEKGDILLTRVGAGIGEAAIIDTDLDFAIYVSLTLIKLVSNNLIDNKYILFWLNSPIGVSSAKKNIYGKNASQGNLNVKNVRDFLVPLPPLSEQKRIVAKLEEILPLCERLK